MRALAAAHTKATGNIRVIRDHAEPVMGLILDVLESVIGKE